MQPERSTKLQRRSQRRVRRLRVVVMQGPDAGCQHEQLSEVPLTVGTCGDNELVLNDPTVSRYHLELKATAEGLHVVDLGSCNGTYIGSVRVERAVVPVGTRLALGGTTLELRDAVRLAESATCDDESAVEGLVGVSEAMRAIAATIRSIADSSVSVLIQGETGTGKEVVARAIHRASPRAARPIEVVDCGSLPATLIASELFGHERGAFTGADQRYQGAFERADGGTLFLDEIGELPPDVQPVLLGALDRRRFRRLGGRQEIDVDVRVVAATNRDLRAEVNTGGFRADLYYRLAVARIVIPPLRDRPEDIEPLVSHLVQEMTGSSAASPFGEAVLAKLRTQCWSGNVRELRNVVEAALAMGRVDVSMAGAVGAARKRGPETPLQPYGEARAEAISAFEREYLAALISRCGGNASDAARKAQMDRPYLLSLLRRHGLR